MPLEIELFEKQRQFLAALEDPKIEQVAFGGARGGGKSHVLRVALILRCLQYPGSKHLLLRRTHVDVIKQHAPEIQKLLQEWKIPFRYNQTQKIFALPQGAELHLGFAEYVKHAEKYQGIEYLTIAYDEGTQFEEIIYDRIGGSARVAVGAGARVKKLITCNPGGIGHGWVKRRFVKPETRDRFTLFIQSRLRDNVVLAERDPTYGDRLTRGLPEWMKRQWLDGDWDAAEGAYFALPESAVRTVEPPYWAKWWAGVDWGFYPSAFGVVWGASWKDLISGEPHFHIYQELKRTRLNLDEQAHQALEMEEMLPSPPRIRYADPATGKKIEGEADEAGRTVAGVWTRNHFVTVPAKRHGRVPGWMLMREMLAPRYGEAGARYGVLTISPKCPALLAEIGDAVFESSRGIISGDDLVGEDHLLDCARYMIVMVFGLDFSRSLKSSYEKSG